MILQDSRLYEAMFLVQTNIASDGEATKGMIQTVMDRAHAELLVCRLWDERRLAYDIDKHKRAVYVLCYFRADGTTISSMERDVQLSEHLLRVLVLRADHISDEELEQIIASPDRRTAPPPGPRSTTGPTQTPPAKDAPAEEAPAKEAPAEEAPAKEAPAKEAPAEDAPAEDAPAEVAPTEDAPVDDAPTEEATSPQDEPQTEPKP